jgi:DNA-binding FadR family transcriptional regulator
MCWTAPPRTAKAQRTHAQIPPTEWGPLELIRARRVVEGEIAALAAVQAKRKDTDAMARAIDAMRADADRNVMPLDGDRAFHTAIVQACGNVVLIETVQGFWDSRRGPLFERLGGYFETVDSWRSAITEHEAIHACHPHARRRRGARRPCTSHLDKSHSRFSASWRRAKKSGS